MYIHVSHLLVSLCFLFQQIKLIFVLVSQHACNCYVLLASRCQHIKVSIFLSLGKISNSQVVESLLISIRNMLKMTNINYLYCLKS